MRSVVLLGAALLLSGCSTGADDGVRGAADDWAQAVGAEDWAAACGLLAPRTREELEKSAGKPCVQALPEEAEPPSGDPREVQAFGQTAQVRWGGETVFLGEHARGWLVHAASCTFAGHQLPYDCNISGG